MSEIFLVFVLIGSCTLKNKLHLFAS
jgi:hypothetical protein